VSNNSHIDEVTPLSPDAAIDDGLFHLVWTEGGTSWGERCQLLRGFLAMEDGGHVDLPIFNVAPCTAYRIEPLMGRMGVDGEEIPRAVTQSEIFPGVLKMFCPNLSENKDTFLGVAPPPPSALE